MLIRIPALLLLLLAALLAPAAANAADDARNGPVCHGYSDEAVALQNLAKVEWRCGSEDWEDGRPITWLMFRDWQGERPPRSFTSRLTKFDTIDIVALDPGGALHSVTYRMRDARGLTAGAVFALPLPEQGAKAYVVRISRPHSVTIASDARLVHNAFAERHTLTAIMILTLTLGLLITPLLFDLNFYFVLRERFVLLHAGMALAMISHVLFAGGLIFAIADVPIALVATLAPMSFPVAACAAAFFLREFLEADALPASLHKMLGYVGWWTLIVPGFCALKFDWSQPFDNQLYFIAFAPIIPIYAFSLLLALKRRSRAAVFVSAAWLPMFAAGFDRQLRGVGAYSGSSSLDTWLFAAGALEVIIMAIGVADRFLSLRHERDRAVTDAHTLHQLSERDPLTGLLNRRALHARFDQLRRSGFTSLGLVDLDRFKAINDQLGHSVGDEVLRSVAVALASDGEMIAFRLGGEEFLILIRGDQAAARAERVRRAISTRIAQDLPGLDRVVTASIGLVEIDSGSLTNLSFAALHDHADRLLYEAKASGRDRMASERLREFRRRGGERRARAN